MAQKPYFTRQGRSFYQIMSEPRADFRGGRNKADVPDQLNPSELVDCTNTRVTYFGAIEKRTGSKRINTTALGAPSSILGLTQWDAPSGKQTVAISNGFLYYRGQGFGDFTQVDPGVGNRFSTSIPSHFTTFRANTSGAPLVLFIASGGRVYTWDGSTITRIDGTNSVPAASLIFTYHTRIFADGGANFPQFVYWSGVGNGSNFTPSTSVAGGSAMVDVLRGDSIMDMEVVGTSLLIATNNSIVRFTGYSSDDIQIAQDTQGVSAELGVVGSQAMLRADQIAFAATTKGPYAVMEAGMLAIGPWVEPDFDIMDRSHLGDMVVGYHSGRREVWFAFAGANDGGLNKSVLVYSLRLQRWYGPFIYPFGIVTFAPYQDATNTLYLQAGCSDGFVRHLDTGALDDVLGNGTGGSAYTMTVEFAPIFFDSPGYQKTLRQTFVQANLPIGHALTIKTAFDNQALFRHLITDTGNPNLTLNYRVKNGGQTGRRLRVQVVDASSTIPFLGGFIVEAYQRDRP